MNYELEPLNISRLTHLEVGKLISSHQSDLASLPSSLITDKVLTNYLSVLWSKMQPYNKALKQIQENFDTQRISEADEARDLALTALFRAVKVAEVSDSVSETEAARMLKIILKKYRGLANLNYESESLGLEKLISEIESDTNKSLVKLLSLDKHIIRLKSTNEAFKSLFSGRTVTKAATEHYDAKALRNEMQNYYKEVLTYVLAMAQATKAEQYVRVLSIINTARKYYSDALERRQSTAAPNKAKTSPSA